MSRGGLCDMDRQTDRFRKLVERSGIKKEMRRRESYEKPSEIKRRARLRAERRSRRSRLLPA
jgi:small subunit ribosomal protein S21